MLADTSFNDAIWFLLTVWAASLLQDASLLFIEICEIWEEF